MKLICVFLIILLLPATVLGEALPPLWGYGQKGCDLFVQVWESRDQTDTKLHEEISIYRDWLTGFISGLNLATGKDVLKGEDINAAMGRIHAECDEDKDSDFFNATMSVIRAMQQDMIPSPKLKVKPTTDW